MRPYKDSFGDDLPALSWDRSRNALLFGRVAGIAIYAHLYLFIALALEVLYYGGLGMPAKFVLAPLALLFGSVLLHEFGHCFAARAVGGEAKEILMWPLGGLASCSVPSRAWPHIAMIAAGPAVNLVIYAAIGFWYVGHGATLFEALLPMSRPAGFLNEADWLLFMAFDINRSLFWFNILTPLYPMDCAQLIQGLLWLRYGERKALWYTVHVSLVAASIYAVLFLFFPGGIVWALILAFAAWQSWQVRKMLKAQMSEDMGAFGYDFSEGHTSLERQGRGERPERASWWARQAARRAERQAERRRGNAERTEAELNRILDKINAQGMGSLTQREKDSLNEASRRKRG